MCSSSESPPLGHADHLRRRRRLGMLIVVILFSFCDLPEITEEALTRELVASGGVEAADVGPFYKQYRCILGFVAQTCYVCVPCSQSLVCVGG